MKVLALDLATVTGCAVGEPNGVPVAWSVDLGTKKSEDDRYAAALRLTHDLITKHSPSHIAVEAPVGGPKTSHYLVGLFACVRGCARARGVPLEHYSIASIRKHFVGKNLTVKDYPGLKSGQAKRAIKDTVIARCRQIGLDPEDDNCADAFALLDYALAQHRLHQSIPAGGLFR